MKAGIDYGLIGFLAIWMNSLRRNLIMDLKIPFLGKKDNFAGIDLLLKQKITTAGDAY